MIGNCSHFIVEATQEASVSAGERAMDVGVEVLRRCFFLVDKYRQRVLTVVADQRVHERRQLSILVATRASMIEPDRVANIPLRVSDQMLIQMTDQQILKRSVQEIDGQIFPGSQHPYVSSLLLEILEQRSGHGFFGDSQAADLHG